MFVYMCSRVVEDPGGSTGDVVVEELDKLNDRLQSEAMQRQWENVEKDRRIHKLETTLLQMQLQHEKARNEKAKDEKLAEKIAELETEIKSLQMRSQMVELHEERETLLSNDCKNRIMESDTEDGRNDETGNESRTQDDTAQAATPQRNENDPSNMSVKNKSQRFEQFDENDQETPVQSRQPPARQTSCSRKLSFLLKRKSS